MGGLSVFVFRRDLRTVDNLGYIAARRESASAGRSFASAFIYNPRQVDASLNPYHCARGVDLMTRCVMSLSSSASSFRVYRTMTMDDTDVLEVLRGMGMEEVHFNADVTPFARERDARIQRWCSANGVVCRAHSMLEYCLVDPAAMPKPYRVFTPFYNYAIKLVSRPPSRRSASGSAPSEVKKKNNNKNGMLWPLEMTIERAAAEYLCSSEVPPPPPPRRRGLGILAKIRAGKFEAYADTRDDLSLPVGVGTTGLSALLKFGAVSVREAFRAVVEAHGPQHALARQMLWRTFYDQLYYHGLSPKAWASPACAKKHGDARKSARAFDRWCRAETGVELVDAAIRELVATGHMHGRARMVAAVYLTRHLGVDWRLGERFFAAHLVDYHPPSNHGGWRWAAGCGADAMPTFRTMNPVRQAEAHDRDGVYRGHSTTTSIVCSGSKATRPVPDQ